MSPPQICRTASRKTMARPKVRMRPYNGSRRYNGRKVATSVTAPRTPTARGAAIRATQKEPVSPIAAIPAYAPNM